MTTLGQPVVCTSPLMICNREQMRRLLRGTRTLREPVPRALGAQQGPSQEEGAETHSTGASKPNVYFNYMYVCSGAQSCLIVTSWTVVCQAPLSMGFPRQENCSGLPFPTPGGLPNPGNELSSPALQAHSLPLSHLGSPIYMYIYWRRKRPYYESNVCLL